jgi:hypothetical protein
MSREQKMRVVCFVTEGRRVNQARKWTMGENSLHVASFGLCWRARGLCVLVAKNLPESSRSLVVCRSRQSLDTPNRFRFHHLTSATCHLSVIQADIHATYVQTIRKTPDTRPFRV